jgi:hypothetical protein
MRENRNSSRRLEPGVEDLLNLNDLFDPDKGHLIGASEGEGEFNSIQFPGSNEIDGAIDRFEIAGFGCIARPSIRALKVKPGGDIPQKRFHTRPFRDADPKTLSGL